MNEHEPPPDRRAETLVVLLALFYPLAFTYVYFLQMQGAPQWAQQTVYTVGKLVQFSFPLAWVFIVRRSSVRWSRPQGADLAWGAAFGVTVFAAMAAVAWWWLIPSGDLDGPAKLIRLKVADYGITTPQRYVLLSVFYTLAHSLLEEYYWRWFTFGRLWRLVALWPAIAVSSLAFAAHHLLVLGSYFGWLSPLTWLMAASVAVGGACWAWLYHRSGSLWGVWLSHFLVDAGVFAIGYVLLARAAG